ncbi:lateral signaling target protein 2 homolog [Anopheles maculipalpis]|uniref:lateral signaling target protein 2 homolog n=1 Tax=Anopheles maculipalpis TaxID=1496333 RepID=UPI002159697E|nr:lateral signaling target protein 2 homolog [Anopheles maculipalpis]
MSIGVNLRVTGHTSIGGRKYQEDCFSVAYQQTENDQNLEYAYFGIYDGHGGAEASLFAKEHLMNTIVSQKLFWSENDDDVLKSIREGYIQTHYSMWREQDKWPKTSSGLPSTAGTTASIAFIRRGKIYIGHVGDSGIVLGYQNDKESAHDGRWVATPLTEDHKPESYAEKMRIMSCGGKVVTKSGVPRVVWNRPRIGHKGPVRRSTPIDEIPFLAVARSLGDLWSYNSAMDEFVVSPVPDVSVIEIDPKKYRCLIFGTDGLWNVMSPKNAVDIVRNAEMENIRIALEGGNEWKNPSKLLVNEALERWSRSNMKADNTSVVIIMLDPPGPPKRDVLKSVKDSIQHVATSDPLATGQGTVGSNIIHLFDCITRGESIPSMPQMDSLRYSNNAHQLQHSYQHHTTEEYCDTDRNQEDSVHQQSEHLQQMAHMQAAASDQYISPVLPSTSYQDQDLSSYTDSFAESYNTLLNRSFENTDHSYTSLFHPVTGHADLDAAEDATETYGNKATMVESDGTHDEDDATMYDYSTLSADDDNTIIPNQSRDSTYSLTNLQTKSERLRAEMLESCSSPDTYYHQQQSRAQESTGYQHTENLAIIEHFHNYHHPAPSHEYEEHARTSHSEPIEHVSSHHNYHQYHQMDQVEEHQFQHHHHHHHHHQQHYQDYQMERYDYRHHPSEATCSKYSPSQKAEHVEDDEEEEMAEESGPSSATSPQRQIISIHGHRIQINEVSSSYVPHTSKALLTHTDTESTASSSRMTTITDSGDDENSASSTTSSTVKQLVVPVLVKQRSRKPPGSSPSARVITIFYETRSSSRRRHSRANRNQRAELQTFGGAIVKRRKTVIRATNATITSVDKGSLNDHSDLHHPTTETLVMRRALRSNGVVNGGAIPIPTSTGGKAAKLVLNEFGVSTTTPTRCLATLHANLKAPPVISRNGCSTRRRMRLDEEEAVQRQEATLQLLQAGSTKRAKQLRRAQ